jgi:hypothetical protein
MCRERSCVVVPTEEAIYVHATMQLINSCSVYSKVELSRLLGRAMIQTELVYLASNL